MQLRFPSDAVVVVAGVAGAGKTTLIRRAVDRDAVRVVDTDDRREAGARRLLYAGHYARIAAAVAGRRPVVIHTRGTQPAARRAIALLAALRGRPAHLVMLHAERAEAQAGQRARGRVVATAAMDRQLARWRRLMRCRPAHEGWASVTVLDRTRAARVEAFAFAPAVEPALAAGGYHVRSRASPVGPWARVLTAFERPPSRRGLLGARIHRTPEVTATWQSKRSSLSRASSKSPCPT